MFNTIARMIHTGLLTEPLPVDVGKPPGLDALHSEISQILGRALCIRHVDAGSCNGCELEIQALNNPYYNLEGAGVKFVASPRHADLLLVTGPVSVNMEEALRRTYDAIPSPKLVIAVGDCGSCGGLFGRSYASRGSVSSVIPVNYSVPGCPPDPASIIKGILQIVALVGVKESTKESGVKLPGAGTVDTTAGR